MKTFVIPISDAEALNQSKIRLYTVGETLKLADANLSLLQASNDDNEQLERYVLEAVDRIISAMSGHVMDIDYEGSNLTVIVSDGCSDVLKSFLTETIQEYLTNYIVFAWLQNSYPAYAKPYLDRCVMMEANAVNVAHKRIKPIKQ